MRDVREGYLEGGLPCLSFGDGPPLVVFPGLGLSNANPTGFQRWAEVRLLAPLARAFTVYRMSRAIGLKPRTAVPDLANHYAEALEREFDGPVGVLGISTGGSVALQLAADRPGLVRRLVVAGAAYRLEETGREFQRRIAELAAAGERRNIAREMAPDIADCRLGRRIVGGLLWLAGPLVIKNNWDPSDMITTIMAVDAFDLGARLGEISARPSSSAGTATASTRPSCSRRQPETSKPPASSYTRDARTFADRRFARDVADFLSTE